ncbi:zinc finger CCHC domain-containing protein 8 [Paragonimus westermani]|uniref:Zinc finger CCHC domain-containing protein 8 n=1 Tax=Paragonimus westermani TaxID=34504 RepID=A0A5J4NDQ5_9TREM|nr:zinc finger CCHC domain-containing protein 8 [Paragonimus westermani]
MVDDSDGLFVIDKSGASDSKSTNIIYDFKDDPGVFGDSPAPVVRPAFANKPRRGITGKRYHEAGDFSKFRPGRLSDELREALNLAKHELPLHVYRMRTLGYPPGWLRKARVGGELTMFDSVAALAENAEVSYNREALIDYPGFNAAIEYPFVDECDVLNCPRMQSHHLLDNFYAALSRSTHLKPGQIDRDDQQSSKEISNGADNSHTEPDQAKKMSDLPSSAESASTSQLLLISETEDGTPTPNRPVGIGDGYSTDDSSSLAATNKRPNIDAFSVGVQPFRPFENLPGTQGGYKRVLETLRTSRVELSTSESSSNPRIPESPTLLKSSTPHPKVDHHSWHHSRHISRSSYSGRKYR